MPNWKKLITSGSDASLNSLSVATSLTASIISASSGITGSLFGTSSWAQNALTASNITPTGTNAFVQGGNSFGTTALLGTNDNQNLQLETSGSVRVHISSSGNVGIGTTTPSTTLQVAGTSSLRNIIFDTTNIYDIGTSAVRARNIWSNGNVVGTTSYFTSAVMYNSARIGGEHTATALLHISGSDSAQMMRINSPTNANILFVSGSGRVGIGTTTPRELLHVAGGNIALDASRYIDWGSGNSRITDLGLTTGQGYPITISTFGPIAAGAPNNLTEKLRLTGSGSLGLGTTNPLARLHISGSDGNDFLRITSGSQNILNVRSGSAVFFAGTGVAPTSNFDLDIQGTGTANGGSVRIAGNGTAWSFTETSTVTRVATANPEMFNVTMGGTSATLIQNPMKVEFNANQNATSGSGYTVLRVNATHATTAGTGSKLLQTWEFGGVRQSVIDISGSLGIGTGSTPNARLFVSGANADNLLRVSSPSATNALFVSGSGNVGIGTTTPTTTLNVNGTTLLQGGQTTVRGSGTTSATTALRVENANASASLIVLDNGNVGISTTTPADLFTINSPSSTGSLRLTHLTEIETLRATSFHSGLYIGNNIYYSGSGDPVTNSLYAVDSGSNNRGGNLLLIRANNGTTALGGFYFYTAPSSSIANTTATLTENLRILPSASVFSNTRVGIGATPNTSYAFDIQSSAPNAGAARINGNNTVWVFDQASQVTRGTTSLARMFLVQMGPVNASSGTQTALTISQSINQSSTAGYTTLVVNANETGTGSGNKLLQAWQFNGTNLTVINNSGSLGVGTATPTGIIDVFQGGNSRILVKADDGFVGIQQPSPTERIHITSDPATSKYLQIDATSTQAPPTTVTAPDTGYGNTANKIYLAEPDYWMEIKLNGNIVLIPCYSPA